MTLGNYNRHQAQKKKQAALAAAFPQGIRCQKCLGYGHWSYECKGKRKILVRPSRTKILRKNLQAKAEGTSNTEKKLKKEKRRKSASSASDQGATDTTDGHNSMSSSSSSSDSSDSSSSSSSDSDSDSSSSSSSSSD